MIEIHVPLAAPGLNGKDGLLRIHFRRRTALVESWCVLLRSHADALPPKPLDGPLEVRYVRRTPRVLMDWDNACASFKVVGDALVRAGFLADDNPSVIARFLPEQEKGAASTSIFIRPLCP